MNTDYDLSDFEHMWDGSEAGWALNRHEHDGARVTLRFAGKPGIRDLAAIRKLLPEYQELQPADVKQRLGNKSELTLDPMQTDKALELARRAGELGLSAEVVDASHVSYSPLRRTPEGGLWGMIIEDEDYAQALCERMLEADVPVVNVRDYFATARAHTHCSLP